MSAPKDMFFESEVRPEQNGRLLLDSLSERFTYHSREEWIDRLSRGLVHINGKTADLETVGHRGDKVVYHVENYSEPEVPTHYETLFDDDEFLLVAKPAGVPVHHTGRIFYNTFTAIVRRGFDCETATPMHRLDRDTGGIMLFAKSADTASRFQKHLDRILLRKFYVAVVSGLIAKKLEYQNQEIEDVILAGLLHDIGKLKIDLEDESAIITTNEDLVIKHPQIGYEIIMNELTLDERIARVALEHHENNDGSGYPHGLSNDYISEWAQIVNVANYYDNLACNRTSTHISNNRDVLRAMLEVGTKRFSAKMLYTFVHMFNYDDPKEFDDMIF